MPPPTSLRIDRFKRLPRASRDVWQGGVEIEQGEAWTATPEAIRWLRAHAPARRSSKTRR
jgi:hypothetical protein